jgi:hypothetical protein
MVTPSTVEDMNADDRDCSSGGCGSRWPHRRRNGSNATCGGSRGVYAPPRCWPMIMASAAPSCAPPLWPRTGWGGDPVRPIPHRRMGIGRLLSSAGLHGDAVRDTAEFLAVAGRIPRWTGTTGERDLLPSGPDHRHLPAHPLKVTAWSAHLPAEPGGVRTGCRRRAAAGTRSDRARRGRRRCRLRSRRRLAAESGAVSRREWRWFEPVRPQFLGHVVARDDPDACIAGENLSETRNRSAGVAV